METSFFFTTLTNVFVVVTNFGGSLVGSGAILRLDVDVVALIWPTIGGREDIEEH